MLSNRINTLISKPVLHSLLTLGFVIGLLLFLGQPPKPSRDKRIHRTLSEILESGEITMITRNNNQSYYRYRGETLGFEYDLAKEFADYLGVRLNVKVAPQWGSILDDLLKGKGDFVATSLTSTPERMKIANFSDPYMKVSQHIIVNKRAIDFKGPEDLTGKTVHVRKGTSYEERLRHLKESGIDITINVYENVSTEDFIRNVASKNIGITIADSNIAMLGRRYYPKAQISTSIKDDDELAWAIHPNSKGLLKEVNLFLKMVSGSGKLKEITDKYYAHIETFDYVDISLFHKRVNTRLPKYLDVIMEEAERNNLDWRMIAAQMYQESHFNPFAQSHAGAYGLMQLTRNTANDLGVKNIFDPKENIVGGAKHMNYLFKFFDHADSPDRLLIALGAYNVGQGHILDARNIARDMGLDPNRWTSLEKTLPLLRFQKYYKNAIYGYCRGTEPVDYVKRIMVYYDILKHFNIEYETIEESIDETLPYENLPEEEDTEEKKQVPVIKEESPKDT